jgi:hypothetical protein
MPVQHWEWCQRNKGNNAIVTMVKTSAYKQWQQCQRDKGNGTSMTMAITPMQ